MIRDLAEERENQLVDQAIVYVDSEGRGWRKKKTKAGHYEKYVRIETKPKNWYP